jgi:ABC-type Fe3+/spermidine/putrescine transport system ATPase subunit
MTVALKIDGVSKTFDGGVRAVDDCSLLVEQGEIVSLLGPSGCGKTTLLNLIAGFEIADSGSIMLGEKDITHVAPHMRNAGMVFQSYALFPHMTVLGNIMYGPKVHNLPSGKAREIALEMAALLKIDKLVGRYPSQLSGGQRQRVAVARALALQPEILLLDEAFSALDRNLREDMQIELSLLLRRLGITTILVTHDQREAFSLSDRIAVMEEGRIGQIGTGQEVYASPRTPFVFEFLGSTNRMHGSVSALRNGAAEVTIGEGLVLKCRHEGGGVGSQIIVGVRAEAVKLSATPTPVHTANPATVALTTFLGQTVRSIVRVGSTSVVSEAIFARADKAPAAGDQVYLDIAQDNVHELRTAEESA